jgi:serine protein kinase
MLSIESLSCGANPSYCCTVHLYASVNDTGGSMAEDNDQVNENQQEHFLRSLEAFTRDHKASHWAGPLSSFLSDVLPADPKGIVRSSHQYIWDMIRWTRRENAEGQWR